MLKLLPSVGLGSNALLRIIQCAVIGLSAVVAAHAITSAVADELPVRKVGRWQLTTVTASIGMKTFETCITATDSIVGGDRNCSTSKIRRLADEIYVDVVCKTDDGTEKTSTVFTGDFTTWYRAMSKVTFEPPQDGVTHMGVTVDGKYLSAQCNAMLPQAPPRRDVLSAIARFDRSQFAKRRLRPRPIERVRMSPLDELNVPAVGHVLVRR